MTGHVPVPDRRALFGLYKNRDVISDARANEVCDGILIAIAKIAGKA